METCNLKGVPTKEPTAAVLSAQDVDIVDDDDVEHSILSEAAAEDDPEVPTDDIDDDSENETETGSDNDPHSAVPVVFPRRRFVGHCNVETVKDGQFFF
jgi:hypothetical protein